jgi:hypothetical protein
MAEIVGGVWEPPVERALAGHRQRSGATCCPHDLWRADHDLHGAGHALSFTLGSILGLSGGGARRLDRSGPPVALVDLMMAIPSLIFGAGGAVGAAGHLTVLILVMGLLDARASSACPRGGVDITVMDYVEAAKLRGEGRAGSSSARSCPMRCRRWWPNGAALHLCGAVHLDAVLPWPWRAAAAGRLGRDGEGKQGRASSTASRRADAGAWPSPRWRFR